MKPGFNKIDTKVARKLILHKRCNEADLEKLYKAKDFSEIAIWNIKVESLAFLLPMTKLKHLELYGCSIADYSDLQKIRSLQSLFLNGVNNTDLAFIGKLPALRELSLLYLRSISALPNLSNCKKLSSITLWNCKQLRDIASLRSISSLKALNVVDIPQSPKDLEPFIKMPSVKTVAAQFGNTKLNNEFEALLAKHNKKQH
jgi:hypothetical protein